MNETGKIERLSESRAWVRASQSQACHACRVRGACGTGMLASRQVGLISVDLPLGSRAQFQIGSELRMEVDDALLLKATFKVYVLPILVMLACATLPVVIFELTEFEQIAAGILGLVVGLWWSLFRSGGRKQLDALRPRIALDGAR